METRNAPPDWVREGLASNQEKHGRLLSTKVMRDAGMLHIGPPTGPGIKDKSERELQRQQNPALGTMRVTLPADKADCPGCGRRPGKRHAADCATAPCPKCRQPRATCGCRTTARMEVWAGK
jgi:hypothetical protein